MITQEEKNVILAALRFRKNMMLTGNPEGNNPSVDLMLNPAQSNVLAEIEHVLTVINDLKSTGEYYRVLTIDKNSTHKASMDIKEEAAGEEKFLVVQGEEPEDWYWPEEFFKKKGEMEFNVNLLPTKPIEETKVSDPEIEEPKVEETE